LENLQRRNHIGDLDKDGKIILKRLKTKYEGVDWTQMTRNDRNGGFYEVKRIS
jgi:hypothetical protein